MFPGKSSVPAGCLWSLRVWLRVNGVDHRLFGEDELWVAKDPDFNAIGDASFARLRNLDGGEQVYHGYVGKALVTFTIKYVHIIYFFLVFKEILVFFIFLFRWECVSNKLYKYSLMYEASGVGDILFEDFRLRLDGDPRAVTFLILCVCFSSLYFFLNKIKIKIFGFACSFFVIFCSTVPNVSMPVGASHKLRVWLRSIVPLRSADASTSYVLPFNDSYIYQRIWKYDSFKIGGKLEFETLGSKMTMGFSSGMPETIVMPNPPPLDLHSSTPSIQKERKEEF